MQTKPHKSKNAIYPEPVKSPHGSSKPVNYNGAAALAIHQHDATHKPPEWHSRTQQLGLFLFVLVFIAFIGSIVSAGMRLAYSSQEITIWQAYKDTHGFVGIAGLVLSAVAAGILIFTRNDRLAKVTLYAIGTLLVFQSIWSLVHVDVFSVAIYMYLLWRIYEISEQI